MCVWQPNSRLRNWKFEATMVIVFLFSVIYTSTPTCTYICIDICNVSLRRASIWCTISLSKLFLFIALKFEVIQLFNVIHFICLIFVDFLDTIGWPCLMKIKLGLHIRYFNSTCSGNHYHKIPSLIEFY